MKNLILLILIVFCISNVDAQENQKYINVNGTSELILNADQINFTIQIRIINESLEESKKNNDKYLDELLTILKNSKINTKDIGISPLSLGKNYDYTGRERVQKGYFTDVDVSVLLTDLSKYYELINKIVTNNNFEITNSSYAVSDYENQHKLAYEKALKAAKEKAEYMVNTLEVKLGEVLEIEEHNQWQSYPNPSNNITVVNSQGENVSGKVTIRRSVRVKFAIN